MNRQGKGSKYTNEILFNFKKEVLPFAMTWVKLEDVMLNRISQMQKDKFYTISLTFIYFFWLQWGLNSGHNTCQAVLPL
jgi:hypothetical protein